MFAFAPFELFWLAPPLWLGFFLLLRQSTGVRQAALLGWCFGLGLFAAGVSWVFVSLSVFGEMPWWAAGPATALFCAFMALWPALAAGLWQRWRPSGALGQALWLAALFALVEWSRTWLLTGFPWLLAGYSQTPPSPLAGFAPVLGVHGVGLLVLLCGVLWVRWPVGLAFTLAALAGGQALRGVEWTEPAGVPVAVALIQGNVPQELKFRPEMLTRTLLMYRDQVERHAATLTVLPETALPVFYDQLPAEYLGDLAAAARKQGGDLLLGTVLGEGTAYYNAAVSLGQSPAQAYRKAHLVPFGELIPDGFAWFMALARIPLSSFTAGEMVQPPLAIAGQRLAVDICYEDAFGEEIRRNAAAAGMLVNLSNTAWFGRSLAQPQHLQMSRLRALETGRPMLRATNTGMTAVIAADGTVSAVLPPFEPGVLKAEVVPRQGATPYLAYGNLPFFVLAALLLAAAGLRRRG